MDARLFVADVTVVLTEHEYKRLTAPTTATGGFQVLIHRLQRGVRKGPDNSWLLTISKRDLDRIPRYWKKTGGKPGSGGYQHRLPIRALRPHLRSVAPMFDDGAVDDPVKPWVYFKRAKLAGREGRIKIGTGGERRSRGGYHTDNPDQLEVLLKVRDYGEKYYHLRFQSLRCSPNQEWFWPGPELLAFIDEASAEQKLQEQRRRHDAAVARQHPGQQTQTEGTNS